LIQDSFPEVPFNDVLGYRVRGLRFGSVWQAREGGDCIAIELGASLQHLLMTFGEPNVVSLLPALTES
jgi:hypothetical protein